MPDYYYHTWRATNESQEPPTSPFSHISTEDLLKEHRWNESEQDREEIELEIAIRILQSYLNGYEKALEDEESRQKEKELYTYSRDVIVEDVEVFEEIDE